MNPIFLSERADWEKQAKTFGSAPNGKPLRGRVLIIAFNNEGQILVGKEPLPGNWINFPGGTIDKRFSIVQTAVKELGEETGWNGKDFRQLDIHCWKFFYDLDQLMAENISTPELVKWICPENTMFGGCVSFAATCLLTEKNSSLAGKEGDDFETEFKDPQEVKDIIIEGLKTANSTSLWQQRAIFECAAINKAIEYFDSIKGDK